MLFRSGCHVPPEVEENGRMVKQLKLLPVDVIGTDPNTANTIANNTPNGKAKKNNTINNSNAAGTSSAASSLHAAA